ncbi:MAG: DUF4123 domain-containing protein [Marivita sp.]|uniref:DUF4123 domain-containing protein n=1 Tax=Marivita sp. TaxID=2003365 RepID=UPI003EF34BB7
MSLKKASFAEYLLSHEADSVQMFAVLDGAQFDNLPADLRDGNFVRRALYLDRGNNDPDQVITAPYLITLDETATEKKGPRRYHETVADLLTLLSGRPAAVFWKCPDGEETLFKHLRGLNMVEYPKQALEASDVDDAEKIEDDDPDLVYSEEGLENLRRAQLEDMSDEATDEAAQEDGSSDAVAQSATVDVVTFRHSDANVMAQMLMCMSEAELARLYGPASLIAFQAEPEWTGGGLFTASGRPEVSGSVPRGMLAISVPTIERLDMIGDAAGKQSVLDYLHEVSPEYCEEMTEQQLIALVETSRVTGAQIGFRTQYGLALWAFTLLISDMEALRDEDIQSALSSPEHTPDRSLEMMLDQMKLSL